MIKAIRNSVIKHADIEKFYESLNNLQSITNLVNAETEEISLSEITTYLSKLLECTNKLVIDPIKVELSKLMNILEDKGTNDKFFEQLNYLIEFSKSEKLVEEYEPINDKFIEVYNTQEKEKGISLLCNGLDELTGGLHKGKICTIVGGPGSMKTTYATNICYEAIKDGKNVCFLSLEETPMDIYSKLLSRASIDLNKGITVQDITQHKLVENEEKVLIEEVYPYLENLKGTFYLLGESDLGDLSHITIERQLKFIDEKIKLKSVEKQNDENHGIDIIVIDHLQMFKYVSSDIKDEYQLINNYVSFFRKNSKNFLGQNREIIVILLSQCNREGIAYAGKHSGQYLMQHVAESSEIERASSYIISVYTDAMTQISKQLKIGAIKLRGSALPLSTINVFADGQFYQVGETQISEEHEYSYDDINLENNKNEYETLSLDKVLGVMN